MNNQKAAERLQNVAGQLSPGAGVVIEGNAREQLLLKAEDDIVRVHFFELHGVGKVTT